MFRAKPDCDLELSFNLVQPLSCDLVLRDKTSSTQYLIEHKTMTISKGTQSEPITLIPSLQWIKKESNWHFLFLQHGDWLVIHTRGGHEKDSNTPAASIDLRSLDAASKIATTIRSHGGLAKQRLQTKWRTLELYEDSLPDERSKSMEPTMQKPSVRAIIIIVPLESSELEAM